MEKHTKMSTDDDSSLSSSKSAHFKFRLPGTPRSRSMGDFQSPSTSTHVENHREKHHKKRNAAEVYLCVVPAGLDKEDPPYRRSPVPESLPTVLSGSEITSEDYSPNGQLSNGVTGHGELGVAGTTTMQKRIPFTRNTQNRNVRTAPSTPLLDTRPSSLTANHGGSTNSIAMPSSNTTRLSQKGSDNDLYEKSNGTTSSRTPSCRTSTISTSKPKVNKVNEKFHKIFKNIPEEETVLNAYSCAYFGDILLQGYLYISPNFFCFYSKILSHEKVIEIAVPKVQNITRERTAFIIPNAIGVRTSDSKYVFGSLMSRDNTYKLMWSAWKKARPDDVVDFGDSINSTNNNLVMISDSSDSDAENVCSHCGELLADRQSHSCSSSSPISTTSPESRLQSSARARSSPTTPRCAGSGSSTSLSHQSSTHSSTIPSSEVRQVSRIADGDLSRPNAPQRNVQNNSDNIPYLLQCTNYHSLLDTFTQLVSRAQSLPKTCVLLAVCAILVVFLLGSAVIMTSKIMLLQSRLDGSTLAWGMNDDTQLNGPSLLYKDTYYLNNQYHVATVEKLHTVLQANIQLLSQVHKRLQSLNTVAESTDGSCTTNSCAPET